MHFYKAAFVGSLVLLINFSGSAQTNPQKLNLATHREYRMSQNMMGQEIAISSNSTVKYDINLKNGVPGSKHLSASIKSLTLTGDVMGRSMSFDSDKKEDVDGEIGRVFKGILHKSFDMDIGRQMVITMQIAAESSSKGPEDEMLASFFGGDINKELPTETLFNFGIEAVGDIIIDKGNIENTEIKKSIKYVVMEITGNDARLVFNGTETTKRKQSMQTMEVTIITESKLSGELAVDIKTGVIKYKNSNIEGIGTTEIMNQSIPFSIKQTVKSSTQ